MVVRRQAVVRFGLAVGTASAVVSLATSGAGATYPDATSVPRAVCGPGARPETSIDGRVPQSDYDSGRVARGYQCNTALVGHQGVNGGFKVIRYVDPAGHVCAFYDRSAGLTADPVANSAADGLGVAVLDMADPTHPRLTATLTTPAMLTPHETLLVNTRRGLLGAVAGNALTNAGVLELYDVRSDCRRPTLLSATPTGFLGHESGFAPDGRTFWSSSQYASLHAIDVSDPRLPVPLFTQVGVQYHGLRLSADGRTMYVANLGRFGTEGFQDGGLRILDVSEVQDRVANPTVRTLSSLSWPEVSIPQVAEPFTRDGHRYVLEVDEFDDFFSRSGFPDMRHADVGAARIINVDRPRSPYVVSSIRLAVHEPKAHAGTQWDDPGASSFVQGYAAHYCSVPTRANPRIAACSMILSGLRIFDLSDLRHPVEVGYFNRPLVPGAGAPNASGAYAMSQPAWDVARRTVWYSDSNSGFFAVRLTNGVGRLLPR